MYTLYEGKPVITRAEWCAAGLTARQYHYDVEQGAVVVVGGYHNPLILVTSIRRPERLAMIEAKFGPIEKAEPKPLFEAKVDAAAREWYTAFRKADGSPLEARLIEQYTNRASLLEALKRGLEGLREERARVGTKVKMGEWYEGAMKWYNEQRQGQFPCAEISNVRSFERVFKSYCKEGYASVVSGRLGNDNTRLVSAKAENLIVALWRTNGKPFKERVWELYMEFVCGDRELYDQETGEVFRPDDYRHKGRTLELSPATIWRYISKVMNTTAVYADRNGNFAYQNAMRPKHIRKVGQWSLSKISMDDVALSRKTKEGKWVYKYIAVDVLSGYWFRPSYHVGKADTGLVVESFRNMFCELWELGLPVPGELEVEHHLMENIEWLNEVFPIVRFCASATEKRAEHNIRQFKYGASKDAGHTVGRWYARSEAYRGIRIKSDGNYTVPVAEQQRLIADDLEDIERHNNELHPKQKTFPGMTRRDVMIYMVNKQLKQMEPWYLLRWIGNCTKTSIVNNNVLQIQGEKFWLSDFESLKRLKPNSRTVEAYWLPSDKADASGCVPAQGGNIDKAYLWQGDTYIGEAENMEKYRYNEFAIERTEEDEAAMLEQCKRVAKFDKMVKGRRAELPKVGGWEPQGKSQTDWETVAAEVVTVESEQPENYEGDEFEVSAKDYAALARETV